ncbi:MAG: class I SAM-dependent methyltransferase [Vulcanimicrobiaceae bacterium]
MLEYRFEALKKYRARFVDDFGHVPHRVFYPYLWMARGGKRFPGIRLGPIMVGSVPPAFRVALKLIAKRRLPGVKVLDIGCWDGMLGRFFEAFLDSPIEYVGVDIAPPDVDFPVYPSLDDVKTSGFDLIMMSEVAEHMTADTLAEEFLPRIKRMLADTGTFVLSTPNPLVPTVLHRDVTHVQHYPWYDLYAIMRLFFDSVTPLRTHFVTSPRRLCILPVKKVLSYFLEVDWCDGLTFVATSPTKAGEIRPSG